MDSPQKILIIRFSSLGDIIQVSAFAGLLRQKYPQAAIHWLTKSAYGELVAAMPAVDRVWTYNSRQDDFSALCQKLKAEQFDLVCDLHSVWRSIRARHIIGGRQQLIYHKPYFKRWLLFHCHKDCFARDFHVVADYCALLGTSPGPRPLTKLAIPPEKPAAAAGVPLVACVTGAAWPQKRYPVELWIRLLEKLLAASDCKLLLVGGPKEPEPLAIVAALPAERVIMANNYSLMETMAMIASCRTAIGNDTGFMHGAEALGLDTIFLLGPTSRHGGGYPNRPGSFAAEIALPCRPCSQKGDRKCRRPCQDCFYQQDQEKILDELLSRLA